jgi:hypothetical protein
MAKVEITMMNMIKTVKLSALLTLLLQETRCWPSCQKAVRVGAPFATNDRAVLCSFLQIIDGILTFVRDSWPTQQRWVEPTG